MTTQINLQPLPPLEVQNIRGFNIANDTDTTFKVAAGECWDETSTWGLSIADETTVNGAVNGVNGLDTGDFENNTLYAVFIIGSQSRDAADAVIFSKDYENPIMPNKYDLKRRIGFRKTKTDGSAEFVSLFQSGDGARRTYIWNTNTLNVLSGGNETTFTPIDLSSAVPAIDNIEIGISIKFVPNTAGNQVDFIPYGGAAITLNTLSSVVAAETQQATMPVLAKLNAGVPTILYKVSEATDAVDVYVISFVDNL